MLKTFRSFLLASGTLVATFSASGSFAGDAEERYFLVVASIKTKPFTEFSPSEFLKELGEIERQFSERCGIEVAAWHSDLVDGFEGKYWFVYTSSNEAKSEVEAFPRDDQCSQNGYIKGGLVTFPGSIQTCAYCASDECPERQELLASGFCD